MDTMYSTAVWTILLLLFKGVESFSVSVKDSKTWVCGCLGETVNMTVLFEPPDEALIVVRWFQDPGASEQRVYSYIPSLNKSDTSGPMNGRVSLDHVSTTSPHGSVTLVIHRLYENDTVKSGSTYIQYRCEVQDSNNNQHTAFFNLTRQPEAKCQVVGFSAVSNVTSRTASPLLTGQVQGYFASIGAVSRNLTCNNSSTSVALTPAPPDTSTSSRGSCMQDATVQFSATYNHSAELTKCLACRAVLTQGGLSTTHSFTPCFNIPGITTTLTTTKTTSTTTVTPSTTPATCGTQCRCLNGGVCKQSGVACFCTCPCCYTGINCQTWTGVNKKCASSPCHHGATCREVCSRQGGDCVSDFQCGCSLNYNGPNCQGNESLLNPTHVSVIQLGQNYTFEPKPKNATYKILSTTYQQEVPGKDSIRRKSKRSLYGVLNGMDPHPVYQPNAVHTRHKRSLYPVLSELKFNPVYLENGSASFCMNATIFDTSLTTPPGGSTYIFRENRCGITFQVDCPKGKCSCDDWVLQVPMENSTRLEADSGLGYSYHSEVQGNEDLLYPHRIQCYHLASVVPTNSTMNMTSVTPEFSPYGSETISNVSLHIASTTQQAGVYRCNVTVLDWECTLLEMTVLIENSTEAGLVCSVPGRTGNAVLTALVALCTLLAGWVTLYQVIKGYTMKAVWYNCVVAGVGCVYFIALVVLLAVCKPVCSDSLHGDDCAIRDWEVVTIVLGCLLLCAGMLCLFFFTLKIKTGLPGATGSVHPSNENLQQGTKVDKKYRKRPSTAGQSKVGIELTRTGLSPRTSATRSTHNGPGSASRATSQGGTNRVLDGELPVLTEPVRPRVLPPMPTVDHGSDHLVPAPPRPDQLKPLGGERLQPLHRLEPLPVRLSERLHEKTGAESEPPKTHKKKKKRKEKRQQTPPENHDQLPPLGQNH